MISDIVLQAIIGGIVTIIVTWMQLKTRNAVKEMAKTVNSNTTVQLELNSAVARHLADLTENPTDKRIADLAERLAQEHKRNIA